MTLTATRRDAPDRGGKRAARSHSVTHLHWLCTNRGDTATRATRRQAERSCGALGNPRPRAPLALALSLRLHLPSRMPTTIHTPRRRPGTLMLRSLIVTVAHLLGSAFSWYMASLPYTSEPYRYSRGDAPHSIIRSTKLSRTPRFVGRLQLPCKAGPSDGHGDRARPEAAVQHVSRCARAPACHQRFCFSRLFKSLSNC
jgi:hypothetical protein